MKVVQSTKIVVLSILQLNKSFKAKLLLSKFKINSIDSFIFEKGISGNIQSLKKFRISTFPGGKTFGRRYKIKI